MQLAPPANPYASSYVTRAIEQQTIGAAWRQITPGQRLFSWLQPKMVSYNERQQQQASQRSDIAFE